MSMQDVTSKIKRNAGKIAYRKAHQSSSNDMILRRSIFIPIAYITIFICLISVLASVLTSFDPANNETYRYIAMLMTFALASVIACIMFIFSKTVVNADGVTAYRLYGMRHINFDSITNVEYTNRYGGCVILSSEREKILVPIQSCGFIEFFKILTERVKKIDSEKIVFENGMKLPQYYDNLEKNRGWLRATRQGKLKIVGLEDLGYEDMMEQIQLGERFVTFRYSLFFLVFWARGTSSIYFGRKRPRTILARISYTVFSLLVLILTCIFVKTADYSTFKVSASDSAATAATIFVVVLLTICIFAPMGAIITNIRGGTDVTDTMIAYIHMKLDK